MALGFIPEGSVASVVKQAGFKEDISVTSQLLIVINQL